MATHINRREAELRRRLRLSLSGGSGLRRLPNGLFVQTRVVKPKPDDEPEQPQQP